MTTGEYRFDTSDPANEAEPGETSVHTYGIEGDLDLDALADAIMAPRHAGTGEPGAAREET